MRVEYYRVLHAPRSGGHVCVSRMSGACARALARCILGCISTFSTFSTFSSLEIRTWGNVIVFCEKVSS